MGKKVESTESQAFRAWCKAQLKEITSKPVNDATREKISQGFNKKYRVEKAK